MSNTTEGQGDEPVLVRTATCFCGSSNAVQAVWLGGRDLDGNVRTELRCADCRNLKAQPRGRVEKVRPGPNSHVCSDQELQGSGVENDPNW